MEELNGRMIACQILVTGLIARVANDSKDPLRFLTDFRDEILAVGGKIRTALNGHLCTDLDDPQVAMRGITGLQVHAGGPTEVRFKDFRLELDPKFELKTMKQGPADK